MFADKGHAYAAEVLEKDGVELLLGTGVTDDRTRSRDAVRRVDDQDPLRHLGRRPDGRAGRRRQRAAAGSRRPDRRRSRTSRSTGFPGVLVIGDIANIPDKDGKTHPQLGSVALQSGGCGRQDDPGRPSRARPPSRSHYLDKGTMAMIGRGAAVAQVKGVELHGKIAFAAWLGVHAALMTGGSNRVDAFKSWARDFFGKDRAPQALDRSGTARMTWEEDDVDEPAAVSA